MPYLNWLSREEDIKAARKASYRLLEEISKHSAGDPSTENMLIQGDNLETLKALLPYYAGKVKCIYIDPPYNTKSAFEHYDDSLEHTTWLAMMYPRLELLRELLAEDGSIWISIDDIEGHYLKVLMDEVFGRNHFILSVAWKKRDGAPNDRTIAATHEHIFVWGKSSRNISKNKSRTLAEINFNLMPRTDKANAQYRVFTEPGGPDVRGAFRKIDTTANGKGGRHVDSLVYPVENPYTGEMVYPRKGTCWRHNKKDMEKLQSEKRLYWGVKGTAKTPMRKLFEWEAKKGMTTPSIWSDVAFNQHASREIELLFGQKAAFETPKPERLIQRILHIASNPGDIVLDSFLGSGTTAAVAHKMGRRYIGIEMGEHAVTHCAPRLQKVIEGEQGGISKSVEWEGGGGYRFYRLGEPVFDEEGSINPEVRFPELAAHIWFSETGHALSDKPDKPFLGIHDDIAYALLYNGILGDRKVNGGNVLTHATIKLLKDQANDFNGPWVIYGEWSPLTPETQRANQITFKQTPYDIRAR